MGRWKKIFADWFRGEKKGGKRLINQTQPDRKGKESFPSAPDFFFCFLLRFPEEEKVKNYRQPTETGKKVSRNFRVSSSPPSVAAAGEIKTEIVLPHFSQKNKKRKYVEPGFAVRPPPPPGPSR